MSGPSATFRALRARVPCARGGRAEGHALPSGDPELLETLGGTDNGASLSGPLPVLVSRGGPKWQ